MIRGLTRDYELFHNEQALAGARRLADFLINEWLKHPGRNPASELADFFTTLGIGEALLALAGQAEDNTYLDFCVENMKLSQWNTPIVVGRHGDFSVTSTPTLPMR